MKRGGVLHTPFSLSFANVIQMDLIKSMDLCIGVLGLQGDFEPHIQMLQSLNVTTKLVRKPSDLDYVNGLILPGGESTTMTKLIDYSGLYHPITDFIQSGNPVWGTCAGSILLGNQGTDLRVRSFGMLDIDVERNAYGRQTESFFTDVIIDGFLSPFRGVFIRAPKFVHIGQSVKVAGVVDHEPVLVVRHKIWASTFHPELTNDARLHEKFLRNCLKKKR